MLPRIEKSDSHRKQNRSRRYNIADDVKRLAGIDYGDVVTAIAGFRSCFRDRAGNVSNFPREVVETALAHVIGDKAEQVYPSPNL